MTAGSSKAGMVHIQYIPSSFLKAFFYVLFKLLKFVKFRKVLGALYRISLYLVSIS